MKYLWLKEYAFHDKLKKYQLKNEKNMTVKPALTVTSLQLMHV
jgi:hypothetical protein